MLPSCARDPANVNDASVSGGATPGQLYVYAGGGSAPKGIYKYVKFLDAVTYVNGHCCIYANADGAQVTNDKASGTGLHAAAGAGATVRVMTQNYYGYLLVYGVHTNLLGDGSVAAGEAIFPHATTDGAFDTRAETVATGHMGQAFTADDSDSIFTGLITCL